MVKSNAASYCPSCNTALEYRDSCLRTLLKEGRERNILQIRRLKCPNCGQIHRELPDILAPYKQYSAEIISGALDGVITLEDEDAADYPAENTHKRWRRWLEINELRIDGYLKSFGSRLPGFTEELLNSGAALLQRLRSSTPEWLEIILRFIYNAGGFLVPC